MHDDLQAQVRHNRLFEALPEAALRSPILSKDVSFLSVAVPSFPETGAMLLSGSHHCMAKCNVITNKSSSLVPDVEFNFASVRVQIEEGTPFRALSKVVMYIV